MAINVRFMTHVKRENSTLLPTQATINAGINLSCLLLDATSIHSPTFKISYQNNPSKPIRLFNYVWVDDFQRYYFITDITSDNNFWYVSCECDVLASFKTYIGAGQHYILRSASARNEYIIDETYISRSDAQAIKSTGNVYEDGTLIGSDPFSWDNGHSYVLGIVGNAYNSLYQFGSVVYYWMNDLELGQFINYLMNSVDTWSGIPTQTYSAAVQAALLNPVQYIVSAIALPFSKPSTGATDNTIYFGYYHYSPGGSFAPIVVGHNNIIKHQTVEFTLQKHPQASTRGIYLNSAAYTSYTLHLGPFGDIPLDPALLVNEVKLTVDIATDVTHGTSRIIVKGANTNNILYHGCAQVGVSINLSSANRDIVAQNTNMVNGVLNTVNAAASSAMGNISSLTSVVSTPVNAVADAARLKYPQVLGGGEAGTFLSFHDIDSCYLLGKFYWVVGENETELGRPLYDRRLISSLSGFILCSGADVAAPATQEENIKINNYMNTGFYFE